MTLRELECTCIEIFFNNFLSSQSPIEDPSLTFVFVKESGQIYSIKPKDQLIIDQCIKPNQDHSQMSLKNQKKVKQIQSIFLKLD